MSFWLSIKNIATKLGNKAQSFNQELHAHMEDFRERDDEFLKRKVQKSSGAEKMAAYKILKERGYGKTEDDE